MTNISKICFLAIMLLSLSNAIMLKSNAASKQCTPLKGFKSGCKSIGLNKGRFLETTCQTEDGREVSKKLDLNNCFTNNIEGKIEWNG